MFFSNNLDPDQDQQNIGPDLDPKCLKLVVFLETFSEKLILKSQHVTKNREKIISVQRVNWLLF